MLRCNEFQIIRNEDIGEFYVSIDSKDCEVKLSCQVSFSDFLHFANILPAEELHCSCQGLKVALLNKGMTLIVLGKECIFYLRD